jgi:hypothetical protein
LRPVSKMELYNFRWCIAMLLRAQTFVTSTTDVP